MLDFEARGHCRRAGEQASRRAGSTPGAVAHSEAIRDEVVREDGATAHKRATADADLLMHARIPRHTRAGANVAMAGERRRGREQHTISQNAVVRDVAMRHDKAVVSDGREATARCGAAAKVRILSDAAALSDNEQRRLSSVFEVLRCCTKGCKCMNDATSTDRRVASNAHVRIEPNIVAERCISTNDAIRPDFNSVAKSCSRLKDGSGMYSPRAAVAAAIAAEAVPTRGRG